MKESIGELVISLFKMLFYIFYGLLTSGFLVYKFWYWFIAPVFSTVPTITYYQAIGIGIFLMLFKNIAKPTYVDDPKKKADEFKVTILLPWVILFFGWIGHIFIS